MLDLESGKTQVLGVEAFIKESNRFVRGGEGGCKALKSFRDATLR